MRSVKIVHADAHADVTGVGSLLGGPGLGPSAPPATWCFSLLRSAAACAPRRLDCYTTAAWELRPPISRFLAKAL